MSDEQSGREREDKPPAGPPPVDLNRAVSNEPLLAAMAASFAERTEEAAERLWAALNEADFLVAVSPGPDGEMTPPAHGEAAEGEQPLNVMSAADAEGGIYLLLFTDWDAITAYTDDTVLTLVMPADEAWSWVIETEEFAGVVVNPGGLAQVLDRGQLGYLMHLIAEQEQTAEEQQARLEAAKQELAAHRRAAGVELRQESTVRFVAEQDGPAEQRLKLILADLFGRTHAVTRAYLARADYGVPGQFEVVLGLRGEEDQEMLAAVGRQFASLFGEDIHMDILFLDDELEAQLHEVCAPFYFGDEADGASQQLDA